jgi:transposase
MRDLVRAREAAMEDLRAKRQHLQSFLLRHGRIYPGLRSWTLVHARWLSSLTFEHWAQYLIRQHHRLRWCEANSDREWSTRSPVF